MSPIKEDAETSKVIKYGNWCMSTLDEASDVPARPLGPMMLFPIENDGDEIGG